MRRKHWLFLLLVLSFSMPVVAGGSLRYYTSLGISPNDAFSLRFGIVKNKLGGEIYAKSDIQRLRKDISKLDGKVYRMSIMGGLTYRPVEFLLLTANAGYGTSGIYRVDATQTAYGAEDLKKGFEAGLGLHVNFGRGFALYAGWSFYPIGQNDKAKNEYTVGIGFVF